MLSAVDRRAPESALRADLVATLEAALPLAHMGVGSPEEAVQRQVLSMALRTLAAWLHEQSVRLADPTPVEKHRPTRTPWPLTRREREVVAGIARGLSNRDIAGELVITVSTTERHVANILTKLGMRSRAQVAVWAVEHGLGGSNR